MDTATSFLTSVLSPSGSYCLWARRSADKHIIQAFYPTIPTLLNTATAHDAKGYDVYFGLGTFGAVETRVAENVQQMQSLFLDFDCGEDKYKLGKGYLTQGDALQELKSFCKTMHLPKPTVVDSGYGMHVYWPLATPLSRQDWLPLATKLKTACLKAGLRIDPAVCTNAAQVLRIPGTHNYKYNRQEDVNLLHTLALPTPYVDLSNLLGVVEDVQSVEAISVPITDNLMQDLAGSYTSRFRTIIQKTAEGKGCAQLGQIISNQETILEPLWRAGLSIAQFCTDKSIAIHHISSRHPKYSHEDTEAKAQRIKGPYLCSRFDMDNPGVCPSCAHWGKIKSPISLGREVVEATDEDNVVIQKPVDIPQAQPLRYTIPSYPKPFFRGKSGGIFKHSQTESGDAADKLIYFNDLYVVRRLSDPEFGESIVMRLHLPMDGVREFTVPLSIVGTAADFRKHLAMQGVAVVSVTELMEYTMRWVNELQHQAEAEEARRQFGWVDDEGKCFAVGNMLVYADRVEVNSPSSATSALLPAFKPRGTLEGWQETMRFYNRPGMEPHQFMIGISFGAVLMEFQPLNAAAFHLYSKESGLGKTTGILAGASIWGNPDLLMLQERDTFNSKMNRAEVYKNLPVYMDELTNTKPQDLSDWAYQLPSGMQRNRMGAKGNQERARGKPWKTLFGTTGNTSMLERISLYKPLPKAEAQRVLEFCVTKMEFESKAETDELASRIKLHYGHAAIPYLQYVMANLEAVKELADQVQQKIDVQSGLKAENRFWSVLVSRAIAGLMIAKEVGLIDWKIGAVVRWVVDLMQQTKEVVQEMNVDVTALVTDYMMEHYDSILRIRSGQDLRAQDVESIIAPDATPRGALVARYEYDTKKLFFLPSPFKQWCSEKQHNYSWMLKELKKAPTNLTTPTARLTKGTNLHAPPVRVLCIDCSSFLLDDGAVTE